MPETILLPYGHTPMWVRLPHAATVIDPPAAPRPAPVATLLEAALDAPIGERRLEDRVGPRARVVIAVSDATRPDPRDALVRALLGRLPDDAAVTLAVASGTHPPCAVSELGLGADLLARTEVVVHDARDDRALVPVGVTRRGTAVRLHRCVLDADLVIATGAIKPHYFAGYGAGVKAIFPGLGGHDEIRANHRLKREAGARPGVVDGNPCREDLEEVVEMLPAPPYLLDVVLDARARAQAAVAGEVRQAFRVGAALCEPWFRIRAPASDLVIVSDGPPLTASLYQASKLVAACAPLVVDGGTVVLAAECDAGTGPVETVNEAIYRIGLAPRLPARHRVVLVSSLPREEVAATYCAWAPSVEEAVAAAGARRPAVVLPRAGALLVEREAA